MTSNRVKVTINDHIAHVQLIRADKMNAMDEAMIDAILDAQKTVAADPSVRVVVISGEGRSFCAGMDVSVFAAAASSDDENLADKFALAQRTHGNSNRVQWVCQGWRQLPIPVIASLHGTCIGAGLQLALGADIRFAHPDTKLSIMEMKWGMIPDMGMSPVLRSLVGDDVMRELTYTAKVISSVEGKALGLVTHTSDTPLDEAMALAKDIAGKNPTAIRAAKTLMNDLHDAGTDQVLLQESELQEEVLAHPNQKEAVFAQMQKRPPNFKD